MRELEIGTKKFTVVVVKDKPGEGGACHEYQVLSNETVMGQLPTVFANVHFQKGPIKENGVNGCHNEDLLAIIIDRLQHFQTGKYHPCRENAKALERIEEAMHWLNHRTQDRIKRGVEGTNQF